MILIAVAAAVKGKRFHFGFQFEYLWTEERLALEYFLLSIRRLSPVPFRRPRYLDFQTETAGVNHVEGNASSTLLQNCTSHFTKSHAAIRSTTIKSERRRQDQHCGCHLQSFMILLSRIGDDRPEPLDAKRTRLRLKRNVHPFLCGFADFASFVLACP
ncbi:hypothetical protein BDV97DRAFT_161975 [Delphinella strobiligena]|nr:hypothetical protein BDV97DRAFT_161975 [Delphinella strobiligena]